MKHAGCAGLVRASVATLVMSLAFWLAAIGRASAQPQTAAANAATALRFDANVGQFDPRARYVARGRSYALFLTCDGPVLALRRRPAGASAMPSASDDAQVVTMKVKGAASTEPSGVQPLTGRSSYFVGSDPASWRSDVQTYGRVRYASILPGVDVEYYGTSGRELEYDFTLAPGVTPSSLQLELGGVSRVEISSAGQAILQLPDGSKLIKEPPVAYQVRGGRRAPVPVSYALRAGGLGFLVGAYDAALPLVIDPVLTYSTYYGGGSFDQATAIAADSTGNIYVVGYTASTLFPTSSPVQPKHGGGSYDAFVLKLNPTGSSVLYATYLGGSGADMAYAVAADSSGNAYVAGLTNSTDFPVASAFQSTPGGAQDAFVTKLSASGAALVYSTYLGGAQDDYAKGIAVTEAGAAYLVGTTFSTNFPKAAPLQASLRGTYDAFVTQLTPVGTGPVYSTYLGGTGTEYGNAIALDTSGNAYVVGSTTSNDFPTANARQSAFAGGGTDAFVSKLNLAGTSLAYSTYLGGTSADEALGVGVTQGTAIVVGDTLSLNFPLASAAQQIPGGNNHTDAFITRFDPSGSALLYSTYWGGTGNDSALAVASDSLGDAYVAGQTDSADLPLEQPIAGQESYRGAGDAMIAALNSSGTRFVYASYLGGSAADGAVGIAAARGTTYVVGNTLSSDFPTIAPIFNGSVGSQDSFISTLPSIESVAAPAASWWSLCLLAGLLFAVASLYMARAMRAQRRV